MKAQLTVEAARFISGDVSIDTGKTFVRNTLKEQVVIMIST